MLLVILLKLRTIAYLGRIFRFSPKSLVEKSHSGGFFLQIGNARDLICFNRAHFVAKLSVILTSNRSVYC